MAFPHSGFAKSLYVAEYVGKDGNCGTDGVDLVTATGIKRWKCTIAEVNYYDYADPQFSIEVDPEGFPVVAYRNNDNLYVANPKARLDLPGDGWEGQEIDNNQSILIKSVGAQADLSLNDGGLGLVGYLESGSTFGTPDKPPKPFLNLKAALQFEPVPPKADFVVDATSGFAPMIVAFTNQSTGDFTTCEWDFGDGDTSMDCDDPTHTYSDPGNYTVSLTVSGYGEDDTKTRTDYITVTYGICLPLILK